MSRVNLDIKALGDFRLKLLAAEFKIRPQEALGWMVELWMHCVIQQTHYVTPEVVKAIIPMDGWFEACQRHGLIRSQRGKFYVTGTRQRIEWYGQLQRASEAAAEAKRQKRLERHELSPLPPGAPDGAPAGTPPDVPLAPALAPALVQKKEGEERQFSLTLQPGTAPPVIDPFSRVPEVAEFIRRIKADPAQQTLWTQLYDKDWLPTETLNAISYWRTNPAKRPKSNWLKALDTWYRRGWKWKLERTQDKLPPKPEQRPLTMDEIDQLGKGVLPT